MLLFQYAVIYSKAPTPKAVGILQNKNVDIKHYQGYKDRKKIEKQIAEIINWWKKMVPHNNKSHSNQL